MPPESHATYHPKDFRARWSRHNLAVGRLGCGGFGGGGDRATTFGHSEISIRSSSSSSFAPTPEELLKADAWTGGRRAGGREEPNLLRSDANDMKSHSLSLSESLRLIVHWIMSRGEEAEEERDGGGDAGDGEVGGAAEAALAVRADHVTD